MNALYLMTIIIDKMWRKAQKHFLWFGDEKFCHIFELYKNKGLQFPC